MKLPLKILVGDLGDEYSLGTPLEQIWNEVTQEWDLHDVLWNNSTFSISNPNLDPILDMFSDEGISIKNVVKDLNDPKTLFTEYSRSFTVPASKKNNRIFKHYYNIDVANTIDSRELVPAKILMNNTVFKVGNIRVEGVRMSSGVPQSYKITFIGKLSELARRMGKDRLSSLDLSVNDLQDFDAQAEVSNTTKRPIMFPLTSRNDRYIFHSTVSSPANIGITEGVRNIAFSTTTPSDDYGIRKSELVGAMSVGTILDEIEVKYGFTFSGAFTYDYVRDLYLYLHQTDKERFGDLLSNSVNDFNFIAGSSFQGLSDWNVTNSTLIYNGALSQGISGIWQSSYYYIMRITATWSGQATVTMNRNGVPQYSTSTSGNQFVSTTVQDYDIGAVYTVTAEANSSVVIDVNIELEAVSIVSSFVGFTNYVNGSIIIGSGNSFYVNKNMPKMGIIDFLSSLFKMFNIIAEIDSNLNISTKHYDHFMSGGESKDVTKFVDVKQYDVNRPNIYSSMQMEFSDSKTALELGYLAVNAKEYGELAYELQGQNGVKLSGSEYKLKVKNQRIPVEPLTDLSTNNLTEVIYTVFSDLKGSEQQIDPMFTYMVAQTGATPIAFYDDTTVTSSNSYVTPSNTYQLSLEVPSKDNIYLGLYFGEELNEYNVLNNINGVGLWSTFYKGTTALMFDEGKRRVKFKSYLPQSVIMDLKLSDTLIISNHFYNINSIETNYLSGVSDLELTLVGRKKLPEFDDGVIQVTNNSTTETLHITFIEVNTGRLVANDIAPLGVFSSAMVGNVIGRSHPDFTIEAL